MKTGSETEACGESFFALQKVSEEPRSVSPSWLDRLVQVQAITHSSHTTAVIVVLAAPGRDHDVLQGNAVA